MELTENAVELWCEEFERRCRTSRTNPEDRIFLDMILRTKDILDKDETRVPELLESSPYLEALWKRSASLFTYTLTPSALLYLGTMVTSFGISTMVCAYLQWISHKRGIKTFDVKILGTVVFPNGFPRDIDLRDLWEMQKVRTRTGSDNGLDWGITYRSIT